MSSNKCSSCNEDDDGWIYWGVGIGWYWAWPANTYLPAATHLGYFHPFLAWQVGLPLIHSLSHIIMQICHSLFWGNATHLNDFCHTFSLLQIERLWNLGSPRILGFPNHTLFSKKFVWQVFKHSSTTMTILKHSNMNAQKESHLHLLGAGGGCIALACTFSPLTFGNWSSPQLDSYISNIATY